MAHSIKIVVALLMMVVSNMVSAQIDAKYLNEAISVTWFNPEKYRDVDTANMNKTKYRQQVMDNLEKYIHKELASYLLDDQTVSIKVHDVDLAGDIRPIIGQINDIRIVKSIYPPMIDIEYSLLDSKGKTVRTNRKKYRDIGFNISSMTTSRHSLGYEKAMLRKLFRTEFRQ